MTYWGYQITETSLRAYKTFLGELDAFCCGIEGRPLKLLTYNELLHFLDGRIGDELDSRDGELESELARQAWSANVGGQQMLSTSKDDTIRLFALDRTGTRIALASARRGPEVRAELEKLLRRATWFSKLCLEEIELDFRPATPEEELTLFPEETLSA